MFKIQDCSLATDVDRSDIARGKEDGASLSESGQFGQ